MRARASILLAIICAVVSFPLVARAQWENLGGPGGCAINSIAAIGTYVFVGTEFGIFVSADEGETWTAAGTIGPAAQGKAAVNGFLACGAGLFAYTRGGIYVSTDNAASWTPANKGLPGNPSVICMLARKHVLFCSLSRGGIFFSTDWGAHWLPAGSGLPEDLIVTSLAALGKDLYAGFMYDERIYFSRDDGATWALFRPALPEDSPVEFLVTAGGHLLVGTGWDGIYVLSEDATAWTRTRGPWAEDRLVSVSCLATDGLSVLAGFDETAYLSLDGGATWKAFKPVSDSGELYVNCFTMIGSRLFLGTYGGLFRSEDLGLTWTAVNAGFPSQAEICDLALMDRDLFLAIAEWGQEEWGATKGGGKRYSPRGMVFKKAEGGAGWEPMGPELPPAMSLNCLKVVGPNLLVGTEAGIYCSSDRGRTWRSVWPAQPGPPSARCFATMDGRVFAGTDEGIFMSMDQGLTWKGVFQSGRERSGIDCFVQLGPVLFAGGDGGVYISRDRGETWKPVGPGFPEYATCTSLAAAGNWLVAGVYPREAPPTVYEEDFIYVAAYPEYAILVSANEGRSWKAVSAGLPKDFAISCLAASGTIFIAALEDSYTKLGRRCLGIFISTDGGESWASEWPGKWRAAPINRFLIDKTDIYAATEGAGVWKLALSALKK